MFVHSSFSFLYFWAHREKEKLFHSETKEVFILGRPGGSRGRVRSHYGPVFTPGFDS